MFKNFNEFISLIVIIVTVIFLIRLYFSIIFDTKDQSFSLKYMMKYYYDNEDE